MGVACAPPRASLFLCLPLGRLLVHAQWSACEGGSGERGAWAEWARGGPRTSANGQKCERRFCLTSVKNGHTMNAALLRRINLQECLQEEAASAGTPRGDPPDGSEAW